MTLSITNLIGNVVELAAARYGSPINYMWGDWTYIANQLTLWGKIDETESQKYPLICLFSPFTENKTQSRYYCTTNVDLLIATATESGLTNEERERCTFEPILRPIYTHFMDALLESRYFDFDKNHVSHSYSENYGYGSRGIMMSEGKRFGDLIDGIDIKNLLLNVKKKNNCYEQLQKM